VVIFDEIGPLVAGAFAEALGGANHDRTLVRYLARR